MTRPRFHCADDNATAPGRSSRGTRSGSMAWKAGKPIAFAHPAPNTISVTRPGLGSPRLVTNVSRAANRTWNVVVVSSNVRRGTRSASAPPSGASNAVGTNPAAATRPVQPALPVAVVTRMPTPTVSIHVPMFDTNAPAQRSAKRRCRNGAKERERFTGTDGTRLLHERIRARREPREHEVLGCEGAVPVVRRDLLDTTTPGERAHELEVVDAQRRDRLTGPEGVGRVAVVHDDRAALGGVE